MMVLTDALYEYVNEGPGSFMSASVGISLATLGSYSCIMATIPQASGGCGSRWGVSSDGKLGKCMTCPFAPC